MNTALRRLLAVLSLAAALLLTACGGAEDTERHGLVGDDAAIAESVESVPAPAPAPPPAMPSDEELYVATLDIQGVYYSAPDAAVAAGRAACDSLDAGMSFYAVGMSAVGAGYSPEDAGYIVGAAIGAFCPEHEDLIG